MPRRFHNAEELFPPATFVKRALAIIYDGLISIAVLLVTSWIYTMIAGSLTGWDRYEQMAEKGQISGDPGLTFVLFLVLYLFFAYFWTRIGQTLGMQVWRVRIENLDGTSVSWTQALIRYVTASAVVFVMMLAAYYIGAVTLLITVPAVIALFLPINGLSLTDRASNSLVVQVPKATKK
ncbi:MAG: RDD family protein [Gammaproteobacteria bacterium]|uniref:Transmembrane protein n=1 Tax=Marinobacter nitratireducens TaxID=1137280 RepID=A0A072N5F3_9GAMM|nr:RDD family protein [Marinobacter nitratireducens]KEF32736.1 Putative transmembrane protein [Marinobacter nitratireducens]TNE79360.1 MAG: RDD family protein [Gammaproteobacteria bacterium]TNE95228.1 MAG: RDD family protein [Gammaproteobacteria bacterium]